MTSHDHGDNVASGVAAGILSFHSAHSQVWKQSVHVPDEGVRAEEASQRGKAHVKSRTQ